MYNKNYIKPSDIDEQFSSPILSDVDSSTLEMQEDALKNDIFMNKLIRQKEEQQMKHNDLNMAMKVSWSKYLTGYLITFTILMFATLWCGIFLPGRGLAETTLNFLITVGFVKVIGVVWVIVKHLFPYQK
jgi:hypothetical protein